MLSVLPAIMVLAVYFGRKIKGYSKKVQKEIAESNNIVEETLQGIRIVKSFTNEAFESLKLLYYYKNFQNYFLLEFLTYEEVLFLQTLTFLLF